MTIFSARDDIVVQTLRVGLTGGIGSGKSAVADVWRDCGAVIVDADVIAREVVAPGTDGLRAIAAHWANVIAPGGALDRAALAAIVFGDDTARRELNGIIHPRVRARADELEREAPPGAIVVHVVPLLFEGDYWRSCDVTVVVIAPNAARVGRIVKRDGVDAEAALARMRAQIDPEEARTRAHIVIENDGDLATLRERAKAVYTLLRDER